MVRIFVGVKDVPYVISILKGTVRREPGLGHEVDARLGRETTEQRAREFEFKPYKRDIMVADIPEGHIAKLERLVAVGKIGVWQREGRKKKRPMARIGGHRGYPKGIVFTSESAKEVKARGGRLISKIEPWVKRVEIPKTGDAVLNIFGAYSRRVRRGKGVWKPPLVLHHRKPR